MVGAVNARPAAIISYLPPVLKPPLSFSLTNPLQISVLSPHTALNSVKGGIVDFLSDIIHTVSPGYVEYVGVQKEDDLGGEGRLVRFQQLTEPASLVNAVKKGFALPAGTCSLDTCTSTSTQSRSCT